MDRYSMTNSLSFPTWQWLHPLDAVIAAGNKELHVLEAASNLGSHSPPSSEDDMVQLLPARQHRLTGRGNIFKDEASDNMRRLEERLGLKSFRHYRVAGVQCCNFMCSTTVSAERMTSIASFLALLFLVDDMCFDESPVPCQAMADCRKQHEAEEIAKRWVGAFRSAEPPRQKDCHDLFYAFEMMIWEVGCDLRRLSSTHPDWYPTFVDSVQDYTSACMELRADIASAVRDLDSYTRYRARNSGAVSVCLLLELANQSFLPHQVRAHPGIQKLTWTAAMQIAFLNDIYSYDHEVVQAADPFNVLGVLTCAEGLPLDRALQRAVNLTNSYTRVFTKVEAELPAWETPRDDSIAWRYVLALKEIMSGNLHFHTGLKERYRWPSLNTALP